MRGPKMNKAVAVLNEKLEQGKTVVEAMNPDGPFQLWFGVENARGKFWDRGEQYPTLVKAMRALVEVIETNCDSGRY